MSAHTDSSSKSPMERFRKRFKSKTDKKITVMMQAVERADSVDVLRKQLTVYSKDKSKPRACRDLVKAALALTENYTETVLSEREAMKEVFLFVLGALEHGDTVPTSREVLENLLDDGHAAEHVKTAVEQARRELVVQAVEPHARSDPIESDVVSVVPPQLQLAAFKVTETKTTQEVIMLPSARIYNEGKNNKYLIQQGAKETRQYGHKFTFGRNRKHMPAGDFSVHDRQENSTFECNGEANYQFGCTLQFD